MSEREREGGLTSKLLELLPNLGGHLELVSLNETMNRRQVVVVAVSVGNSQLLFCCELAVLTLDLEAEALDVLSLTRALQPVRTCAQASVDDYVQEKRAGRIRPHHLDQV